MFEYFGSALAPGAPPLTSFFHEYIPVYMNDNVQFFLAARRRVKTMRTKFVISSDPDRTSRNDSQCMGIVRQVFQRSAMPCYAVNAMLRLLF